MLHQCVVSPGQPFFLTLISRLAKDAGDPDWEYPLTLQEGVPLGVDEYTLTSPGIWPTKEELRGIPDDYEELASPVEDFSDAIKQTFEEEKLLDMVEGPFTKQEAANCVLALWRPLMKGTRSVLSMMEVLVPHPTEKTTAPTVMDCMHGIHWLHASSSVAPGDHTAVSRGERATACGVDSEPQGGGACPGRAQIQPCYF